MVQAVEGGLNHGYMGSTGAPPAAWQGPEDKVEISQQPIQQTASHTEFLTPPRRGVFTSVPELENSIKEYVAHHNTNPKPFIWTKSARDILQKVIRANARLSSKQNATLH